MSKSSLNEQSAQTIRRNRFSMSAGLLGVILCSLPFYTSTVPPMTDVPQHVLVARIIGEYSDPVLRFSEYFTIEWALAPTSLFYLLFIPLQKLVGPFWDARIYLTIWVALIWLAVWYLAKVRGQLDPWIAALVALPLAFCWYAYQGFLPFLMSLPLFALTVAVWFNGWRPMTKIALLWLLFVLLFGFHIVGMAAAAAVVLIATCLQLLVRRDDRWRHLKLAAISVIPVPLMTGVYVLGKQAPKAKATYHNLVGQVVDVIKFTCTTMSDSAAALLLFWLASLGLVLAFRWRDSTNSAPTLISGVFLIGLAITMPASLGSLWPAGPRLLPFAIVLLCVSVRWSELRRGAVVVPCVVLLAGLNLFTARHAIELDRGFRDIIGAANFVQPGKRVLPILVDQHLGSKWTTPYLHVAAILTVIRGGSNPYVIAEPYVLTGASPLKYRNPSDDRRYAFMYDKSRSASDYRGIGDYYDYVLLWGTSPAIESVVGPEMGRMYGRGKATLFARHELMPEKHTAVEFR